MKPYVVKQARHGLGLFAVRNIVPSERIMEFSGPIISYAQVLRKKTPDNAFQISRNRYIDLRVPGVRGNHSCEPNAGVTRKLELIAIKPIAAGDEIRYDYSACMDKDTECDFLCECGAKSCRKMIKGFATLPKKTQKTYSALGIVQRFVAHERR